MNSQTKQHIINEGVFLDSSFFKSFFYESNSFNKNAIEYYNFFKKNNFKLYTSLNALIEFGAINQDKNKDPKTLIANDENILIFSLEHIDLAVEIRRILINKGFLPEPNFNYDEIEDEDEIHITKKVTLSKFDASMFAKVHLHKDIKYFITAYKDVINAYSQLNKESEILKFNNLDFEMVDFEIRLEESFFQNLTI